MAAEPYNLKVGELSNFYESNIQYKSKVLTFFCFFPIIVLFPFYNHQYSYVVKVQILSFHERLFL